MRTHAAAIGFTIKSGWAIAVLLAGPATSPRVVDSRRLELSDPAVPDSRQPYHAGFGTARDAGPALSGLLAGVKRYGRLSVNAVLREYRATRHRLCGAGVVVGSVIDPARLANPHIRIHALEGQLFRRVVQDGVARGKLPCEVWRQRDLYALAEALLQQPERALRSRLAAFGREVEGPWRTEQKAAALAAWLVLAAKRA